MKLTGIKYCGGCNPHIDRAKLALEIEFYNRSYLPWDIGILICGCPAACVDKSDARNITRK